MAKVLVAMSGGVDSSVAAALLIKNGHDVGGVHMRLHDNNSDNPKSCCGDRDARDAAKVANELNIPFLIHDMRAPFKTAVINKFINSYSSGLTPNPCVECNGVLRFNLLFHLARKMGYDYVATGHYARIVKLLNHNHVAQAKDHYKDQSYFLWKIRSFYTSSIMFPLGNMTKDQVRKEAESLDLIVADKPESQDICFVGRRDYREFLAEHITHPIPGPIIYMNTDGTLTKIGTHEGIHNYTVGQSKKLPQVNTNKIYVHSIRNNIVYVKNIRNQTSRLNLTQVNVNNIFSHTNLYIQTRYRGELTPLSKFHFGINTYVESADDYTFLNPAPGQSAVIYSQVNDQFVVVAGGIVLN